MSITQKRYWNIEYNQSFSVPFEYPVHFTRNLFSKDNLLLTNVLNRLGENRHCRAAVYIDSGVADAHVSLCTQIKDYFKIHSDKAELVCEPKIIPGGETVKDGWNLVKQQILEISKMRLDRHSYIIAIGGGAVLDMAGFASAIVHRGLRFIRIPTTTLAQNDAGIGVKNSINDQAQKNFIGTFAPPFAVINDSDFLKTLDDEQWIGGIAEAFKVSIIKDLDFFNFLINNAGEFKNHNLEVMEEAVYRCACLHLDHIRENGDPFEFGSARPLDFGHWAAHKLENMSNYTLGHGQAVAAGIALDSYIAMTLGLITRDELEQILNGFILCGLPIWYDLFTEKNKNNCFEIIKGIEEFREHLGGQLCITLPQGIGKKTEVHHIDENTVKKGIEFLQAKAS
ncbi:3-dehydroquinate synthase [Desulfonema limicola]|uniref:3-dehydroquinate synthase n=1 Tax=Desulfonema limicola TaxID=45656 RepID=A0A975B564_9BACT|nr:3-dehydroquinate synthase [Desulfonema limicola]QTA78992.1 3-dehydroquinate synthase [Desulfonema limicola]